MRKLNITDVFRFSRMMMVTKSRETVRDILYNLDIEKQKRKNMLKSLREKAAGMEGEERAAFEATILATEKDNDWMTRVGIDAAMAIMECAANEGAEKAVCRFLAPVWEMDEDAVGALSIEAFVENLRRMLAENDFKTFFDSAQRMGSR